MADFTKGYRRTAEQEGGWVKDSSDTGKETYAGVSRRYHPHWHGWAIVDTVKNKKRGQIIDNATLRTHVKEFYRSEFWDRMRGDLIKSQRVAEFIYDWHVHSGADGLKEVQRAAGVIADGKIGPKSLAAINAQNEADFMRELIAARVVFVVNIVLRSPSQKKFLSGWLTRILSFG